MVSDMGSENTETTISPANEEKTQPPPPATTLRYQSPETLFDELPQIRVFMRSRPKEGEGPRDFLERLRASPTPEEALTFIAFAVRPKMAVWWGYECLRQRPEALNAEDRQLMEQVAIWTSDPTDENRWRVMRTALYAPQRTPPVFLGLAAGWSGGGIAPNDPIAVPAWRTPKAVAKAVLTALAGVDLEERGPLLSRYVAAADTLFPGA